MARFIKSLLGYDRNVASPEETEAYRVANEAFQCPPPPRPQPPPDCHSEQPRL